MLVVALLLLSLIGACQTPAASDTQAADESALRKLDDEWSKAAGAKDLEKTVSYYSDDAVVMPQNSPPLVGKESIRQMWKGMMATPGFDGGWKATKLEVAKSGDIAYIYGAYEISEADAAGKPKTDRGKYVEVWKKQTDGSWKCTVDMFSSDLPAPAPAQKPTASEEKD